MKVSANKKYACTVEACHDSYDVLEFESHVLLDHQDCHSPFPLPVPTLKMVDKQPHI